MNLFRSSEKNDVSKRIRFALLPGEIPPVSSIHVPVRFHFSSKQLHAIGSGEESGLHESPRPIAGRSRFIPRSAERGCQGIKWANPFLRIIIPSDISSKRTGQT